MDQEKPFISDEPTMTDLDKALLKKKLMKFVCGTADMGAKATSAHCEAVPEVAKILLTRF